MHICVKLYKTSFVRKKLDSFFGAYPEMVIALWADFKILVYLFFVNNFLAVIAFYPEPLGNLYLLLQFRLF